MTVLNCYSLDKPPVDKEAFRLLVSLCCRDVVFLSHDDYYKQINRLTLGSPTAPLLTNGWLSKLDQTTKDDAKLFTRYMVDISREIDHCC